MTGLFPLQGELTRNTKKIQWVAGCDEAGRGALAGPVCAGAVVLAHTIRLPPWIRDSKQLNFWQRLNALAWIRQHARAWSVAFAMPEEIDRLNIVQASILAMHRALDRLPIRPDFIYVDGNYFIRWKHIPYVCIVRGDQQIPAVICASIVAKVYRDLYMINMGKRWNWQPWIQGKGYPTRTHYQLIHQRGPTPMHRKRFLHLNP